LVFLLCAVLGVLAFIKRTSWLGAVPPLFAIVVGLFFPGTMLISEQIISPDAAIEVGDRIPRFTSIDDAGVEFDSRSLNGHLVLIKFFRAHW
jgi:cytochrome oxidase Cu insertion factor (SCO1/SenC/PrrC family)